MIHYHQANEFDRDQVLADELTRVERARTEPLWIGGSLQLGEYDRANETFEVKTERLHVGSNSSHDYGYMVDLTLRQPGQLTAVPASAESARSAVERFNDRSYQILARATPIAASVEQRGSRVHGNLQVDLDLVYVFRKDGKGLFVLTKFRPEAALATADVSTVEESLDAAATQSVKTDVRQSAAPDNPVADNFHADIVDLRLGMSFTEAKAIIQEHTSVGEVLDAKRQPLPDPDLVVPYSSGRLFVSADGMEFIQLYDEPPAATGKVAAVVRWLHRPKGSLGAGDQSLTSLPVPEQINVRGLPGVGFQVGSTKHSDRCGPIISARVESGRTDTLTVWLADQRGYATTIAESRKRVEDGEPADGGERSVSPSGLKL